MPKLTSQQRTAIIVALAGGLGLGIGTLATSDDAPPSKPLPEVARAAKLDPSLVVDTAKYHAAIVAAKQAAGDAKLVDLLSPPVEPGAQVTTGVNLDHGARLGDVQLIGPAVGEFRIDSATCTDGPELTWCEVKATNTGQVEARLTALVEVED